MGPPVQAGSGGPTEILPVSYGLPDQDPMASPPCMMVVTVLVLVVRGCCDGIWRAAVDTLSDAGPGVVIWQFRPLRDRREACGDR